MTTEFVATFDDWVYRYEGFADAVFKTAVQATVEDMTVPRAAGGNMPVDTSYLRNSLLASTAAMPLANREPAFKGDPGNAAAMAQVEAVITGAGPGDTVNVGFTAIYARRMNYGFVGTDKLGRMYNQAGYKFVELAVQKWTQQVEAAIKEGKASRGLD
jgi:hypothetical protein